jgi:hypothetical protein
MNEKTFEKQLRNYEETMKKLINVCPWDDPGQRIVEARIL